LLSKIVINITTYVLLLSKLGLMAFEPTIRSSCNTLRGLNYVRGIVMVTIEGQG